MQIRQITDSYFVSPQISAQDIPYLVQEGFTCILCNRPDAEIPPSHHADVIGHAAKAAGLQFIVNPLTHDSMTQEKLTLQREMLESCDGKVLAYCASGTRSTVAWMLGHTDCNSCDELIAAAARGGYDLEGLRPTLKELGATD